MIEYKILDGVPLEDIHPVFVQAFSDYQIQISLPLWKFEGMLRRRGYTAKASMGAFAEGRLAGFILNGVRDYQGARTVYDLGTGVIPEWRKQGLTSEMFQRVLEAVKAEGIEQYLLEVLTQNQAALTLYQKQGFEITRTLACYRRTKNGLAGPGEVEIARVDSFNERLWGEVMTFWDYAPSWQNSTESVRAAAEQMGFFLARKAGQLAGYGVVEYTSGDVPHLAVKPEHRRQGIGAALLAEMGRSIEKDHLAVLNVDTASQDSIAFFDALGFERFTDQYEMVLRF